MTAEPEAGLGGGLEGQGGGTAEPMPAALDALSVVMPVFNEATWVRRSLGALKAAAAAAGLDLDVVVVDDGSTDGTPEALAELAQTTGITVLTQANAGRLAARTAGVTHARQPWVMLLDSRVIVHPGALQWLRAHVNEHPDRRVWNGHVDVETRRNLFAAFWSGLVKIGWRRYTANPRLVSFGAEEFDYFPKGTTCLVMPRHLLIEAHAEFRPMVGNVKLSSDDTRLLRYVAGKERIWISPDFAFRYHGSLVYGGSCGSATSGVRRSSMAIWARPVSSGGH